MFTEIFSPNHSQLRWFFDKFWCSYVFLFQGQVQPRPRQASKRTLGSARSKHRFLVWERIGESQVMGRYRNLLKNLRCQWPSNWNDQSGSFLLTKAQGILSIHFLKHCLHDVYMYIYNNIDIQICNIYYCLSFVYCLHICIDTYGYFRFIRARTGRFDLRYDSGVWFAGMIRGMIGGYDSRPRKLGIESWT